MFVLGLVELFRFTDIISVKGTVREGGSDRAGKTVQDGKSVFHGCGDCL